MESSILRGVRKGQAPALRRVRRRVIIAAAAAFACLAAAAPAASALDLPPGFQATRLQIPRAEEGTADYISGLHHPTAIDFAPDGKMFVAEANGRVKVFSSVNAIEPTLVASLTDDVMGRGDRGLLGLKLDPEYPAKPFIYLAYTHDAPIGSDEPRHVNSDPSGGDGCDETAPYTDCIASGRIVRIELDPTTGIAVGGAEHPHQEILVESWCQQFLSHSIGDIEFDSTGALIAGGGDGASWEVADHGQFANPCNDPERPDGSIEGGSQRSQDLLTPETKDDPTDYSGTLIRINRETGEPAPGNPLLGGPDKGAERILADGLRNPFRFEFRPGTNELYVGDVGWNKWEELDRLESPPGPDQGALNFGWPCFEGFGPQPDWQQLANNGSAPLCQTLYGMPADSVTYPIFDYEHGPEGQLFPGDTCSPGYGASTTGLAFYSPAGAPAGRAFPESFDGTLFVADSSRGCIWAMHAGADGLPNPADITNFVTPESGDPIFTPVDITLGPEGSLYIPNFFDDSIERIRYFADGQPPVAKLAVSKNYGAAPLHVQLDASQSSDPEGEALHYAWDLDGDGEFDDGPDSPVLNEEFAGDENVSVAVRVTDAKGNTDEARETLYPGDLGPPVAEIDATGENWAIGDPIKFEVDEQTAADPDGEAVRYDWEVVIKHCPQVTTCHTHPYTSLTNQKSGEIVAPPHELPSHLQVTLTARDARGLTTTVVRAIYPRTVAVTLASEPPGIPLTFNATTAPSPLTGTIIAGGNANVAAPESAEIAGGIYQFVGWSDKGARAHTYNNDKSSAATFAELTATYEWVGGVPPGSEPPPDQGQGAAPQPTPPAPQTYSVRLTSKPGGVPLLVGGAERRTPFDLSFESALRATAPRTVTIGRRHLRFRRWSNGGARSQLLNAAAPVMLCAIYKVEESRRRTK